MKKLEFVYLFALIIVAELVIIFPVFVHRNQDMPSAMAGTSIAPQPSATQIAAVATAPPRPVAAKPATRRSAAALPIVAPPKLRQHQIAFSVVPTPNSMRANAVLPRTSPHAPSRPPRIAHAPPLQVATRQGVEPHVDARPAMRMPAAPITTVVKQTAPRVADPTIFEFDATSTHLTRGQTTFLCAGVGSGVKASIRGVGRVAAGMTSCHRVAPQRTTTYVLRVAAAGVSRERNVTIDVRQVRSARIAPALPQTKRPRFDVPPGFIVI
jgi:hypothetical protein